MFFIQFACGISIGPSSRAVTVTLVSSDVDLQTSALTAPALTPFCHLQARIYPGDDSVRATRDMPRSFGDLDTIPHGYMVS
jgi:hypothetical protein